MTEVSSEIPSLTDEMRALVALRGVVAERKNQLKLTEERYEDKRFRVLLLLKEAHLDSAKADGVTASITVKPDVKVTDPNAVLKWLKNNKFDPSEYLQLNSKMVKPVLANAVLKDGEVITGVERTETEFLSLREARKEKLPELSEL